MSLSLVLFFLAALFMAVVIGVGIYFGRRGVFKKTEQAAVQAVTQDIQNAAAKVVDPNPK